MSPVGPCVTHRVLPRPVRLAQADERAARVVLTAEPRGNHTAEYAGCCCTGVAKGRCDGVSPRRVSGARYEVEGKRLGPVAWDLRSPLAAVAAGRQK